MRKGEKKGKNKKSNPNRNRKPGSERREGGEGGLREKDETLKWSDERTRCRGGRKGGEGEREKKEKGEDIRKGRG